MANKLTIKNGGVGFGKNVIGRYRALPMWSKDLMLLVFAYVFFLFCTKLYNEQQVSERKLEQAEAAHCHAATNPLLVADCDRKRGKLDQALQDLASVPESSPDYEAAQSMRNSIEQKVQQRVPPRTDKAEQSCRRLVETEEEFPSTVDFRWFGTASRADAVSQAIIVTVDYTAKNNTGAELPYRMTCEASYNGDVVNHYRTGR